MTQLTQDEIRSLSYRRALLDSKEKELGLLAREYQLYQRELIQKYGLDTGKEYSISAEGALTPVEAKAVEPTKAS